MREANAKRRRQQRKRTQAKQSSGVRTKGHQQYDLSVPWVGDLSIQRKSSAEPRRSNRGSSQSRSRQSGSRQRGGSGQEGLIQRISQAIGSRTWNPFPDLYENFKSALLTFWEFLRWGGTGWHTSKVASLCLFIGSLFVIGWTHQADDFFIYQEDVRFERLTYVDANELYALSDVEGWSVFWLDKDTVKEGVTSHPYVADAHVSVNLPGKLAINVLEEAPVALWVTDSGTLWLLEDGTALAARHGETQGLLEIYDGQAAARYVSYEQTVSMKREVLDDARKLARYFPALQKVTYSPGVGLNFSAPDSGLWIYWGDGSNFETKLKNLLTIQNEVAQGRIQGQLADLRVPEKPIVR